MVDRKAQILAFVKRYAMDHGCGPSRRTLADALGMFPQNLSGPLLRLRLEGRITWDPKIGGSLRVTAKDVPAEKRASR